ncbi:ATP-binding protein [Bacteroidota bacterium]
MIATAVIMALVFSTIYFIVKETVFNNLDTDLSYEAEKHTGEIKIEENNIIFKNKAEWEEREHRELQVNPVFIQLIDKQGNMMDKSPNLKEDYLPYNESRFGGHFDTTLNSRPIRQVQLPIEQNGKIKGYILAAMSSEAAYLVILRLRNTLAISYFIVLIGLYFVSRFLAGRSIKPVQDITNTITKITKQNLRERVELPSNKDELYELSSSFNKLIERIENTIEREHQFTSDASHELRTPLATLRGTLEVLVRKPRTPGEYEEKIRYVLSGVTQMSDTLEQLLLLARLELPSDADKTKLNILPTIIDNSFLSFKNQASYKKLTIEFDFTQNQDFLVPHYYSKLIVDNLISNAIKYSNNEAKIKINVRRVNEKVTLTIHDYGIGIKKEDLIHIYENFYRSDALNHKHITGNGLGLSIVKKSAEAIKADVKIESELGKGTTVTVTF